MESNPSDPKYVVTLVHGTRGINSPWTLEGSDIRKVLTATFGEVSIDRFKWSGGNSHRARLKASRRLAARLQASLSKYPNAKQFVIAHSHGGNVLLYAIRDHPSLKALSGALFMGTPFIACEARDVHQSLGAVRFLLTNLVWAIPLSLFILTGRLSRGLWFSGDLLMAASFFISLFLALGLWAQRDRLVESLVEWGYKRQGITIARLSLPNCAALKLPMFCAIASGDEAYWLISSTRAISALAYNVWFRAVVITLALFATLIAFLSLGTLTIGSPRRLDFLILVLIPGVLVSGVFLRFLLPYLTFSRFVFGGDGAEGWLTHTTVTPLPPGFSAAPNAPGLLLKQQEGAEYLRFKHYRVKGRGLRHSLIYSSEDFLSDLRSLVSRAAGTDARR